MVFKMKHVSECFVDPIASVCVIGMFDGPATSRADLIFEREGIDSQKMFMNSNVLRQLLLSNPDLLATTTGLVAVDIDEYNKLVDKYNELAKENERLAKVNKRNRKLEEIGGVE